MISIYKLKPRFQSLLRPIVDSCVLFGITANHVTVSAFLLSFVCSFLLVVFHSHPLIWLLLPLTMFLRMALNAIDGMLARDHNQKSDLGALLNEMCDVFSDIVLYLPFIFILPDFSALVFAVCILSPISEYAGVLGVMIGASRRYEGPMGKSDRAFVFGAIAFFWGTQIISPIIMVVVLGGVVLLLFLTIYNRLRSALMERT